MADTPDLQRSEEPWAEVRCHARVMRYRCRGAGSPVVLLRGDEEAAPPWPELLRSLATGHRLIEPDLPAVADRGAWLGSFLEGLGCPRVALVASPALWPDAVEVAVHAEQVACIVLIRDPGQGGSRVGDPGSAIPLLVLDADADGAAAETVRRFLGGAGRPAPVA